MIKTAFVSVESARANRNWYLVDAKDKTVGRLATEVASILRGKRNPQFSPHVDTGDFVVVINAKSVRFSGKKWESKLYRYHTGYIGGVKEILAADLRESKPEEVIKHAVQGMLPKNVLGRAQLSKLKVYGGEEHPHRGQKVQPLEL